MLRVSLHMHSLLPSASNYVRCTCVVLIILFTMYIDRVSSTGGGGGGGGGGAGGKLPPQTV